VRAGLFAVATAAVHRDEQSPPVWAGLGSTEHHRVGHDKACAEFQLAALDFHLLTCGRLRFHRFGQHPGQPGIIPNSLQNAELFPYPFIRRCFGES